jgi:DNA primase
MNAPATKWPGTVRGERIDWKDIKDRVDLARVATAQLGTPAKRQGRRLLWSCPFHDDRHPSFEVDTQRKTWKWWPCNLGGDAPALVMRLEGVAFPEAVRVVAELSGIAIPSGMTTRPGPTPGPSASGPASESPRLTNKPPEQLSGLPLDEASSLVTGAADRLWKPEGRSALNYLRGRCLSDETIRAARLGVVDSVWIPTRDGNRCYQARGVVIPWFDGDRLVLAKIRQPDGTKPKYAEAFRDRPAFYPGPAAIRQGHPLITPEGEFDCLLLAQELHDLAAVVTLGGTGSSKPDPTALRMMLRAAPWFLALDADPSGDKAAAGWPARAIRVRPPDPFKDWTEAAQHGINLRRWWLGRLEGLDPAADDQDTYALEERLAIQAESGSTVLTNPEPRVSMR